jgi:hypothetical protein
MSVLHGVFLHAVYRTSLKVISLESQTGGEAMFHELIITDTTPKARFLPTRPVSKCLVEEAPATRPVSLRAAAIYRRAVTKK